MMLYHFHQLDKSVERFYRFTPNKISRFIGNIEAEMRNRSASVAVVRHSFAKQHRESREKLESISQRVEKIEANIT